MDRHKDNFRPDHINPLIMETFPGAREVASVEAIILEWQGKCVKVYQDKYPRETIEAYSTATNALSEKVNGKSITVEFPDGTTANYEVKVVRTDSEGILPDGRTYTTSQFIGGESLHEQAEFAKRSLSNNHYQNPNLFKKLYKFENQAVMAIVNPLGKLLNEVASETEKRAIDLHPDNIKISERSDKSIIYITDISSRVRTLIS